MSENKSNLYIKIEKNTVVTDRHVVLSDIAKMECTDKAALRQLKQKKIYSFPDGSNKKKPTQRRENEKNAGHPIVAYSILKIVELIHEEYPNLDITNEGEADFIIEYLPERMEAMWLTVVKTMLLCVVIFFGSAFTIMAFNNDIGITEVFEKFYMQVMGRKAHGVTELEISYCIGLALGITIFFNHFGKKKITHDPTPLQVEMRKYEQDIDTAFTENAGRKGHSIDVD